ncbi:Leukotriene-B(4) omega-hydroxylase 2 [Seminavis robusta]|uniref:Leukotriene-B(4) omega-hydroxylase 2 n=1 Tax=Seminavis robusta TaxID=568900 RepID=A0A9N8DHK1_9STRA|nr:Leukotriene-B(4) omega-hydroxylase 2 [Seminavis robusta]|eukprot:Sro124_g059980.1 Leukotriene-B(4) omega-hydroxylase 2 (552) ;mRNA; r:84675-86330
MAQSCSSETSSSSTSSTAVLAGVAAVGTTMTLLWLKHKIDQMAKKAETSPFPGIPTAPQGHWLLGHLPRMELPDGFQGVKHCCHDYADTKTGLCAIWAATEPVISVLSGKDAKAILMASKTKPDIRIVALHFQKFLGAKNLLSMKGKEWKLYRTAVHKSFTPAMMEQSQQTITKVGNTLSDSLLCALQQQSNNSETIQMEIHPLMKMATSDVFFETMVGIDIQACQKLELPVMATSFEFLAAEFQRRIGDPFDMAASLYCIPTSANRQHARTTKTVRSFIMDHLTKAKQQQQQQTSTNNNVLLEIWKAAEKEAAAVGESVNMEAVCDVAMTLFFAGYDTTSSTLAYTIYLLAKHPDIYQTCREEIDAVLGNNTGTITGPEQLPYTQAVIYESLRLHSPVDLIARSLEKDTTLHGHVFEKGTTCFLPLMLIQQHEMNFSQPLEMRPDRWVRPTTRSADDNKSHKSQWEDRPSDDTASSDIAPGNRDALVAFSMGARNCVGRNLAMREAVTLLACLLHKLHFELVSPSYELKPVLKLINQPGDGLPMVVKARQ